MTQQNLTTTCVISGGGPAGIMLGYLLARAGIDVTVLEKWPDFFRDFRGDTIHPSTLEVLDELGLSEKFLQLPHNKMDRMTLRFSDKAVTVADLRTLKTKYPFIAFIPQWDFLTFMAEEAKQYPNFHLLMETESTGLIEENGHVVGVHVKNKEGAFDIRAALTVGADGRHSTVREAGKFEIENLGVPIDVLWFKLTRTDKDDQQSLGYIAPGHVLVMLDRREYWQCAFIIEKGDFDRIKAEGLDAFRASVSKVSHLSADVVSEIDSWDKVKLLSVTVDHAKEWAKEGVVLIGDAAHAMSPMGGVGINYAIQDAVAAANILIPAFKKNDASLAILSKIQARREKPARQMQRLQVFLHNRMLFPALRSKTKARVPFILRLFRYIPILNHIPPKIIGIGFLPEHVHIKEIDSKPGIH